MVPQHSGQMAVWPLLSIGWWPGSIVPSEVATVTRRWSVALHCAIEIYKEVLWR